jgi:hypothetical protein
MCRNSGTAIQLILNCKTENELYKIQECYAYFLTDAQVFLRFHQGTPIIHSDRGTMGEALNPSNSKCDIYSESFGTDQKASSIGRPSSDA